MSSTLPIRNVVLSSRFRLSPCIHPFKRCHAPTPLPKLGVPSFWTISHRSFKTSLCIRFPCLPPDKSTNKLKDNLGRDKVSHENVTLREDIYTVPNLLTMSRILACPVLGWSILQDNFYLATGLLVYAGLSDLVDGFLARRFNMRSVLGTILDPAADKTLMTTLTVTLTMKGLLPVSLAAIIIGRDVLLSLSAFYIRYTSLPPPKTFARYWNFSIPSAEVRPTAISKFNTAAQLALMFATTVAPIAPAFLSAYLPGMQLLVAGTTIWSGLSYVFSKNAVRVLSETRERR
ncbi:CDP-alcohol phosphatidyltransferase-domain-containing protein [Pisolithus thermaeus]|nr:CDP-alcohol phosphatidyltransferase-domain-containing protein [Pisolithus thermaeus]